MLQADDKALPSNMNGLYAALIGQLPSTVAGWPWIGKTPTIYPPGTPLPSDWPSDEPNAKDNWHVDMVLTSGPFGVHQQIDAVVWIYDLTLLQATKG